jgi:ribonuclease P protein component
MDKMLSKQEERKVVKDLPFQLVESNVIGALKNHRISLKKDFSNLREGAVIFKGSSFFRAYTKENLLDKSRIAFSIKRKFGNAVKRNKVRRLLRKEFFEYVKNEDLSVDILISVNINTVDEFNSFKQYLCQLNLESKKLFKWI